MAKPVNKWILFGGLSALFCFGCEQSKAQVTKNVTQMTVAELKTAADKGSPQAQYELGGRFHNGNGVLKDSTEAVKWWQKAAAQKFPPAELSLGIAYGSGDGVPKDKQEGVKLCRLAADSGLARAQEILGILYSSNDGGLPQDYAQAFYWFKSAAVQGWPPSQYYLALCFRDGRGTPTNSAEAFSWFQQAGSNGVANAQLALGNYYSRAGFAEIGIPDRIKPDTVLTQEQLTNRNFMHGVEWYRKAANQGCPPGQMSLMVAYRNGVGVAKDPTEACKWYILANRGNHPEVWKINGTDFTSDQISAGKKRAEEFSGTNHVTPKSVQEIPEL
ncbi:MAG: tetratricopeptide repeat protein [Limisphaerales bacterium]